MSAVVAIGFDDFSVVGTDTRVTYTDGTTAETTKLHAFGGRGVALAAAARRPSQPEMEAPTPPATASRKQSRRVGSAKRGMINSPAGQIGNQRRSPVSD